MPQQKMAVDDKSERFAFSVDLVSHSKDHIAFLRALHSHGITWSRLSSESLRRYRDLWLPLVSQNRGAQLVPPVDIAWLWHCHRLAPFRYTSYCKQRFQEPLEQNPPFKCLFSDATTTILDPSEIDKEVFAAETTHALWKQHYPDEPFYNANETAIGSGDEDLHLLDGYDLLGSTERQSSFLWQVSSPQFSDDGFLQRGVESYYKFLKLRTLLQDSSQIIVPTYPIDLMWHTHILSNTHGYCKDCRSVIGSVLNHDDNFGDGDRSVGGELDTAFLATKNLWRKHFHEEYHVVGGMYRGEPPKEYFSQHWGTFNNDHNLKPVGPYLRLVGIQGASSTSPSSDAQIMWCWKETPSQMPSHPDDSIVGNRADCWIKYDSLSNALLESAFIAQEGAGECSPIPGYNVNFSTMKQIKMSTGFERKVKRVDASVDVTPTSNWTDVDGYAPTGEEAFIASTVPSSTTRVNPNPFKKDYIYGQHGKRGLGYYHITTREAYEILEKRIAQQEQNIAAELASVNCCGKSVKGTPKGDRLQEKLNKYQEALEIIKARAKAYVPVGKAGVKASRQNDARAFQTHYSYTGLWYFPDFYYEAGGGCGASQKGAGSSSAQTGGRTWKIEILSSCLIVY